MRRRILVTGWLVLGLAAVAIPSHLSASDYATRCADPDVVRCFGFDDAGAVGPHMKPPAVPAQCSDGQCWIVDSSVKVSGAGSLRFEIPSNTPANTSGSFWLNFMDDYSIQFGEGETFFVQWRQRFTDVMVASTMGGGGWKQVIVGEGDQEGVSFVSSCTELELVLHQNYQFLGPHAYHSCGRFINLQFYDGTQVRWQHQGPPYCYYPTDPQNGCFHHEADEWMTFQMQVSIGTWNTESSRWKIWAAREGESSVMIYDSINSHPSGFTIFHNPGTGSGTNPGAKYGKIWLLPYNTGKDSSYTHPTAYTWYDDLIISRAWIPDPSSSGTSTPPPAPSNLTID